MGGRAHLRQSEALVRQRDDKIEGAGQGTRPPRFGSHSPQSQTIPGIGVPNGEIMVQKGRKIPSKNQNEHKNPT